MKNTIKLFAIIAVIGFSFAGCIQEEEEEGILPTGTYTISPSTLSATPVPFGSYEVPQTVTTILGESQNNVPTSSKIEITDNFVTLKAVGQGALSYSTVQANGYGKNGNVYDVYWPGAVEPKIKSIATGPFSGENALNMYCQLSYANNTLTVTLKYTPTTSTANGFTLTYKYTK
ncbi:MAG: hypothetical protein LBQ89_05335 [Treponema sp.]|jgi:hypothetical protein|nr:hypothetical protein [Treponema sp.]